MFTISQLPSLPTIRVKPVQGIAAPEAAGASLVHKHQERSPDAPPDEPFEPQLP